MLSYAADLVPEIVDDILAVDLAMKTGYAWKYGPFEQIDQLGTQWFADKLKAAGMPVPKMVEVAAGGWSERTRSMGRGWIRDQSGDRDSLLRWRAAAVR